MLRIGFVLTATFALLAGSSAAKANRLVLSTEAAAGLGTLSFDDDTLVEYDPDTDTGVVAFDLDLEFPEVARDIDAAHWLPNGDLVISTQGDVTIDGVEYSAADLIKLDRTAGTASLYFDAVAAGLDGLQNTIANIDAVHLFEGNILFSVAGSAGASFKGVNYTNADVIQYDPDTDTGSLFFDGDFIVDASGSPDPSLAGIEPDLQGFAITSSGTYLISAFTGSDQMTLGGQFFTRDDVVEYDPQTETASVALEGEEEFDAANETIDAVAIAVPEPATALLPTVLVMMAAWPRRRG